MLVLPRGVRDRLVAHCIASLPLEGCGLIVGDTERDLAVEAHATPNVAASALVYEVDPAAHLAIERQAAARGLEVLGAFHSHTHTRAWPSATDVARAVDPSWHWVLVSLRRADPVVRSFRIAEGTITEERLAIV